MSPLGAEINKKEQMQLKANARRSKDICPEHVYVLAMWSRQAGRHDRAACTATVSGAYLGKVPPGAEGLGPGMGPPGPTWVLHQTYQRELRLSLRPAPSPTASRAVGAL